MIKISKAKDTSVTEHINLSIVIGTVDRHRALCAALDSIVRFNIYSVEVLVIDQGGTSETLDVINKFSTILNISHYIVKFKGISRARNFGIERSTGEYILFLDDDAELTKNTLLNALPLMNEMRLDALYGCCKNREGKFSVLSFKDEPGYLTVNENKGMFVESTMFIRRSSLDEMRFDEEMGVGTFYGAEEGYDLLLRLLKRNNVVYYTPSVVIYHPDPVVSYTGASVMRVFSYRCGFAKLCRKHGLRKKYYKRLTLVALYIPYCILFNREKARYYTAELLGLLAGRIL